jgi:predicted N-acyltransferase
MTSGEPLRPSVTVHGSLADVGAAAWDALIDRAAGDVPFLRHGFLSSLEESRCIGPATGWTARYLVARDTEGRWQQPFTGVQDSRPYVAYSAEQAWRP